MNRFSKLRAVLHVPRYRAAWLRRGVAAAVDHASVLGSLNLSTVVDIGANRGQFALFSLHTFPAARVFSFEPLTKPAMRFEAALAHETRVTLYRTAIGPRAGATEMHVSGRDDSSSLLPISAAQAEIFPGTGEVGTETVEIACLHHILDRTDIVSPALLKLDVQGYELEALRGSEDILDCFDFVCLEASFIELYEGQALADSLISWLHSRNYRLASMYNVKVGASGSAIQADVLFKRIH